MEKSLAALSGACHAVHLQLGMLEAEAEASFAGRSAPRAHHHLGAAAVEAATAAHIAQLEAELLQRDDALVERNMRARAAQDSCCQQRWEILELRARLAERDVALEHQQVAIEGVVAELRATDEQRSFEQCDAVKMAASLQRERAAAKQHCRCLEEQRESLATRLSRQWGMRLALAAWRRRTRSARRAALQAKHLASRRCRHASRSVCCSWRLFVSTLRLGRRRAEQEGARRSAASLSRLVLGWRLLSRRRGSFADACCGATELDLGIKLACRRHAGCQTEGQSSKSASRTTGTLVTESDLGLVPAKRKVTTKEVAVVARAEQKVAACTAAPRVLDAAVMTELRLVHMESQTTEPWPSTCAPSPGTSRAPQLCVEHRDEPPPADVHRGEADSIGTPSEPCNMSSEVQDCTAAADKSPSRWLASSEAHPDAFGAGADETAEAAEDESASSPRPAGAALGHCLETSAEGYSDFENEFDE